MLVGLLALLLLKLVDGNWVLLVEGNLASANESVLK